MYNGDLKLPDTRQIQFEIISPFCCLRDQMYQLRYWCSSDREREMSRFYRYQFTIRPTHHARASHRTLRSCFSASKASLPQRAEQRSYLLTSRLFPRLERPFTNSHDFTKPIVRLDDGEAYWILHQISSWPTKSTLLSSLKTAWRW